ncbi:MAG: fumarylacetoacetate hydrolase, partial [Chloroflexi bacterium]|nr:fumarylacetoacetate hydrolase [Chloroflexota bacterium]
DYIYQFITNNKIKKISLDQVIEKNKLLLPFIPDEVWAAGVTYKNSEFERKRESSTPDIYAKVYNAKRPEIFFKATGSRLVAPNQKIGIRSDSKWNVPEAELAVILINNEIFGYSIGNDMTSREIEGENPLYLTQAKIYDKSCSIGPCIIDAESINHYEKFNINCKIIRNKKTIFNASSSVKSMNKSIPYLIKWLKQSNTLPIKSAFLTGTGIVPPPEFTLLENDQISISINEIGILNNSVIKV